MGVAAAFALLAPVARDDLDLGVEVLGERAFVLWLDEGFCCDGALALNVFDTATQQFAGQVTIPNGLALGEGDPRIWDMEVTTDGTDEFV